jgi:glycosyltransferase 2 family protein
MMRQVRLYLPYGLVVVFAAWCLYSIRGDLVQLSPAALARSWDVVVLAALLSLLSYGVRIVRWRTYLARLGHHVTFRFAALTFTAGFAYTLSPGKVGELVRARYYRPLGIPLKHVTAAFFVERLMDLVAMVVLAALLFTVSSGYEGAVLAAAVLVLGVLVSLALLPWSRLGGRLKSSRRLPERLRSVLVKLATTMASTRILLRPQVLAAGFAFGLIAWGLEGTGLGLLASMFPPLHLGLATALGVYGVAVLLGGLSFLPGGLGSTEAVMTALLHAHGYPVSEALLVTLTCRLVTLWLAVLIGWCAVFALRHRTPAVVL